MFTFWDLDGNQHNCDDNWCDFVQYYNKFYYNDCPARIKGVYQSSRYIEEQIEKVLGNGIRNPSDVVHILAWKMGKIKHRDSEEKKRFIYYKEWECAEQLYLTLSDDKIDITPFAECVVNSCKYISKWTDDFVAQVLDDLKRNSPKGIGSVYMVVLLYFMSKGKYPIYDQYADRAVKAIKDGVKPGTPLGSSVLPDKTHKQFGRTLIDQDGYYIGTYMSNLNNLFGSYDNYQNDRDIDRALWVYGHMFDNKFCLMYGDWYTKYMIK